jgi:hypothetical protein
VPRPSTPKGKIPKQDGRASDAFAKVKLQTRLVVVGAIKLARIGSFDRRSGEYGNGSNEVTFESYTEPILAPGRETLRGDMRVFRVLAKRSGSAVQPIPPPMPTGNTGPPLCHPDRSEAKGSAVQPIPPPMPTGNTVPPLCHPDRSEAEWRDLQFSGPFVETCSSVLTQSPI